MEEIKIEKGVPIPKRKMGNGNCKYPWKAMRIGDSFVADCKNISSLNNTRAVMQARTGFTFSARTMSDGKVRVWRVA